MGLSLGRTSPSRPVEHRGVTITPVASSAQCNTEHLTPDQHDTEQDAATLRDEMPPSHRPASNDQMAIMNVDTGGDAVDVTKQSPILSEPDSAAQPSDSGRHLGTNQLSTGRSPHELPSSASSKGAASPELEKRAGHLAHWEHLRSNHGELERSLIQADEIRRRTQNLRQEAMDAIKTVSTLMQRNVFSPSESEASQIAPQLVVLEGVMLELEAEDRKLESLDDQVIQVGQRLSAIWPRMAMPEPAGVIEAGGLRSDFEGRSNFQGDDNRSAAESTQELSPDMIQYLLQADAVDMLEERLLDVEQEQMWLQPLAGPGDDQETEIKHATQSQMIMQLRMELQNAKSDLEAARESVHPTPEVDQRMSEEDMSDHEEKQVQVQAKELQTVQSSAGISIPLAIIGQRNEESLVFPSHYLGHGTELVDKNDYINAWLLHKMRYSMGEIIRYMSCFDAENRNFSQACSALDSSDTAIQYWFDDGTRPQTISYRQPAMDHTSRRSIRTLADNSQPLAARSEMLHDLPRHDPNI